MAESSFRKTIELGSCICRVSSNGIHHFYFVITEPKGNPIGVVLVNITDYSNCEDKTVVLESGHSCIKKKSAVYYLHTKYVSVQVLEDEINNNQVQTDFHHKEPVCTSDFLHILQQGLLKSPDTPKPIKKLCQREFAD